MIKKLTTLIGLLSALAFAAPLKVTGDSSARVSIQKQSNGSTKTGIQIKNTRFTTRQYTFVPAEGDLIPKYTNSIARMIALREVSTSEVYSDEEHVGADFTLTAFDTETGKELWQSPKTRFSTVDMPRGTYVVRATLDGCCGSEASHRYYGLLNGKEVLRFSFVDRNARPIVFNFGSYSPNAIRFLGYLDAYWPTGKNNLPPTPEVPGLKLAGIVTYASPNGTIQRGAVYYDEKAAQDPSSDPSRVEIKHAKGEWNFEARGKPFSVENWRERGVFEADPKKVFTGFTVKMKFFCDDTVEFAIENDRIDFAKAKTKGNKCFKKVVALE